MKRHPFLFLPAMMTVFCVAATLHAAVAFKDINISSANTPEELRSLVDQLNAGSIEAMKDNTFNFEIQSVVLKKAEECIDRGVFLHSRAFQGAEEQERAAFLANRDVIKRILDINKKVLDDYQEKLDEMENPLAFFKTTAWQQPQLLVATASFRIGWNNYYAALLFPEDDPTARQLLSEAIESFSRSLVDSKEDSVIITSVFGRGLCEKRLKSYKDALKDFKSVKEAVKKDDPLYLRCRYEETSIASLTGNFKEVLDRLDDIEKNFPANKIPEELKAGLKDLRESALRALSEKAAVKDEPLPADNPSKEATP